MRSREYWQRRSEQIARRQFQTADDYIRALSREYERAQMTIRRDLEVFYQRFADNNGIVSLAEARRLLDAGELKEFRMTLEEFTAKAKDNADGRWTKELDNVYFRTRVSRFDALQVQIRQQVEMLSATRQQGMGELLGKVYTDTYHRTLFEVQRGSGIGVSFAQIDRDGLEKVLNTEFAGSNWSKRIWGDRDKLASELRTRLAQSFIRGDSIDRTVRDLVDRMGVSYSNAARLVETETTFFVEQATMEGYKASGLVEEYEILATLDRRTSEICRQMDGKVFKLSEQEPGVNAPPFHVRCRTTVMPHFPDEIDPGERLARGANGEVYTVPGDMTYERWYDEHVRPSETPRVRPASDSFLPVALMVDRDRNIWIPAHAVVRNVHVIAGRGVKSEIRAIDRLVSQYGGEPSGWQKLVGRVESSRYVFDVHWYQDGEGNKFEPKAKSWSGRRE